MQGNRNEKMKVLMFTKGATHNHFIPPVSGGGAYQMLKNKELIKWVGLV